MSLDQVSVFMRDFQLADSSTPFAEYRENLQHFSVQGLLKSSRTEKDWKDVTLLLFQGVLNVSLMFKQKVKAADDAEREQRREEEQKNSKKAKLAAQKQRTLEEKRMQDEQGETTEAPPEPKKVSASQFAEMFGMGGAERAAKARARPIEVGWNKDFESDLPDSTGSKLQRRYRDEEEMRDMMAGWVLKPDLHSGARHDPVHGARAWGVGITCSCTA